MAGVGHEVGAHARDRQTVGDVVEGHKYKADTSARRAKWSEGHRVGDRRSSGLAKLHGCAFARESKLECRGKFRPPKCKREGVARTRCREEPARMTVGVS